jgi:hypothetical protein
VAAQEQVHRHRQQRLIGVRAASAQTHERRRIAPPPAHPTITAVESSLAVCTTIWLILYFPVETYTSARGTGVLRLSYVIDLVGMGLLAAGVVALWRVRPFAGALTATGWAWTAANFWRSAMERHYALDHGRVALFGSFGVWVAAAVTLCSMVAVGVCLWVTVRRGDDARP